MKSETHAPLALATPLAATVAALTMLSAALALCWLETFPRNRYVPAALDFSIGHALALLVGAAAGWVAVRHRARWFVAVPAVLALLTLDTSQKFFPVVSAGATAFTSLTLFGGKNYFDAETGELTPAFLFAASGWASAFALVFAWHAGGRPSGAWLGPLFQLLVAVGLGVAALRRRKAKVLHAQGTPRYGSAYFRGFFTTVLALLFLFAAMVALTLPRWGANSGSAGPPPGQN